jgi:phage baseplate assembly protein W
VSDVTVPHFAFPLRLDGSRFGVVEQDTVEEIAAGVEVLVATPVGSRMDEPEYGIGDPTFTTGLDHAAVLDAISVWEPRAVAQIASAPDQLDELVVRAQITVSVGSA